MDVKTFVVLFGLMALGRTSGKFVGGISEADKRDPEVLEALGFAMDEFNKMSNNLYRSMPSEVTEATKQLVAGEKYCIVTVVGTSRGCRNDDKHMSATLEQCPVDELTMHCKFEVLNIPWEKKSKLLAHECVGLKERKISCHPIPEEPHHEVEEKLKLNKEKGNSKEEIKQMQLFDEFIQHYKKGYLSDKQEYKRRFKIFQDNLVKARKIKKMDKGDAQYGVTQFMDLTEEEFKKYYRMPGWGKPSYEMKQAEIPEGAAPASFDWREKGVVTPVKNQGMCGSCWAFSTTGNIEGQWAIKKKKLVSLSEQELVDCDKVDQGCNGGLPSNAYKQIMKIGGLESEKDYPYEGVNDKCKFKKGEADVFINGSVAISSDETKMAAWLATNGPISIGINANMMQFYMGGVAHPWKIFCNPSSLDHGVLIVGYGVKDGWFGKKPYWIIKNSWGPSWGEEGYYLIYRGDGSCGLNTMCTSAVVN